MGDEGDDYLDEEGSTDLRRIVTLDGREVVSGMSFDGCEFVQGDPYQDREPDDEHHEGYTGNEGAPITYYYRDTVLLIVPRSQRASFLLDPIKHDRRAQEAALKRLLQDLSGDTRNEDHRLMLRRACDIVFESRATSHYYNCDDSSALVKTLIDGLVALDDRPRALQSLQFFNNSIPSDTLLMLCSHVTRANLKDLKDGITPVMTKVMALPAKRQILKKLQQAVASHAGQHDQHLMKDLLEWEQDVCLAGIASQSRLGRPEATSVIEMVKEFGLDFFKTKVVPLLNTTSTPCSFTVPFTRQLLVASADGTIPQAVSLAESALDSLVGRIDITPYLQTSVAPRPSYYGYHHVRADPYQWNNGRTPEDRQQNEEAAGDIATLVGECIGRDRPDKASFMLRRIQDQIYKIRAPDFSSFVLPLLNHLVKVLVYRQIGLSTADVVTFFRKMLKAYVGCCIGMEPKNPTDWSRDPVNCNCDYCTRMNVFLRDGRRQVARFPLPGPQRSHLESRVSDRLAYKLDTERTRPSHTLVVTKINDWYAPKRSAWDRACSEVLQQIRALGPEVSDPCLGLAQTGSLSLEHLKKLDTPTESLDTDPQMPKPSAQQLFTPPTPRDNPTASSSRSGQPRPIGGFDAFAVPQKRKATEIIEIDSDE